MLSWKIVCAETWPRGLLWNENLTIFWTTGSNAEIKEKSAEAISSESIYAGLGVEVKSNGTFHVISRTDADILARIAVFEFYWIRRRTENSVTLEERYYAPPSVCCENAKTTSGICLHSLPGTKWILSFAKMVNVRSTQGALLYFEQ